MSANFPQDPRGPRRGDASQALSGYVFWVLIVVLALGAVGVLAWARGATAAADAGTVFVGTPSPTAAGTDPGTAVVSTPLPLPVQTQVAGPTPTPTPTPLPALTPIPKPTPCPAVNCNPWGYNFTCCNFITAPAVGFCGYFPCSPTFASGVGYVVECKDGVYTKNGGKPNPCATDSGLQRPLYAP